MDSPAISNPTSQRLSIKKPIEKTFDRKYPSTSPKAQKSLSPPQTSDQKNPYEETY